METVCTQQSQRSYKPSPCGELENTFWLMGPEWLSQHEKESKSIIVTEHIPEECLKEKTVKNHRNLKSSTLVGNTNDSSISCVIDISRFSNLQRPWVTAHVLRFLKNLKARIITRQWTVTSWLWDWGKGREEAEQFWILDVQKSLQQNENFENWGREFNLFTDCDGTLRCGGTLSGWLS